MWSVESYQFYDWKDMIIGEETNQLDGLILDKVATTAVPNDVVDEWEEWM